MKTLEIINRLVAELKTSYTTTEDFCNWCPVRSTLECSYNGLFYVLDFHIIEKRQVATKLSVMSNVKFEEGRKWIECGIDRDVKDCIEKVMSMSFPLWFDELFQEELDKKIEQDEFKGDGYYGGYNNFLEGLSNSYK